MSIKSALLLALIVFFSPFSVFAAQQPCPTPPYPKGLSIQDCFGYGHITSLGEGTSRLVAPTFSVAAVVVVLYFLVGAFKYLRAGEVKEEIEGARQMIAHAIIGFVILMLIFLALQYLLSSLFGITALQLFK